MRSLTSRDFLRLQLTARFGDGDPAILSAEDRLRYVLQAKGLRNFFFTSTILEQTARDTPDTVGWQTLTETPRFGQPVIVTDMLSMVELPLYPLQFLTVKVEQYGGEGAAAYGHDLFESFSLIIARLVMKHERNRVAIDKPAFAPTGAVPELCDKWLPFVPRLMRPYESWRATFIESLNDLAGDSLRTPYMIPHAGFRAVRPLREGDPYATLSGSNEQLIRRYLEGNAQPETFFFEMTTTLASLGGAGDEVVLRSAKFERPLLILGAASNVDGCQADLYDENDYYSFCYQEVPKIRTAPQTYSFPPLQLIAPNTDYRNTNLFNMWPVPHVLETGDVLRLRLRNGCLPSTAGDYSQVASTRNSEDVRITFVCRTV